MGEYADDAVDASLDAYWDDDEDGELGCGRFRRRRLFRYLALKREQRTNQVVFADYAAKPEEEGF